jgi:hypothetical protein
MRFCNGQYFICLNIMWLLVGCCGTFTSMWVDAVYFMGIYARSIFYLIIKVNQFLLTCYHYYINSPPSYHISRQLKPI